MQALDLASHIVFFQDGSQRLSLAFDHDLVLGWLLTLLKGLFFKLVATRQGGAFNLFFLYPAPNYGATAFLHRSGFTCRLGGVFLNPICSGNLTALVIHRLEHWSVLNNHIIIVGGNAQDVCRVITQVRLCRDNIGSLLHGQGFTLTLL